MQPSGRSYATTRRPSTFSVDVAIDRGAQRNQIALLEAEAINIVLISITWRDP
jgi:hypothetical protein